MKLFRGFIGLIAIIAISFPKGLANGSNSEDFSQDILHSAKTDLRTLLEPHRNSIRQWFEQLITDKKMPMPRAEYLTCDICSPAIAIVRMLQAFGTPEQFLVNAIIDICILLEFAPSPDLCEPTIKSYARAALYIAKNKKNMSNDDFCGILNPGCKNVNLIYTNWNVSINASKPAVQKDPPLPVNTQSVKILQFTDIHIDLHYTEGANADCEYPICCREGDGEPVTNQSIAGRYGHYKCALPEITVREIIRHAKATNANVKYIFVTGDYIHAGAWQYSPEENARHISKVLNIIAEAFPDTPTFPLVGNHEPDTGNLFPPPGEWAEFDLLWLYTNVSQPFAKWLGTEELQTFHYGGYYTSPQCGLRIVALNTNICYINNFWLAYDPIDPLEQLQWLADVMLEAELNNEKVLIIGHIPPGDSWCWSVWSNQFDKIVNRFENIIQGQFYGHAHNEYFSLAFERGTDRPTSTLYNAPSQLTDGMNSAYKVYEVDGDRNEESTWEIMDHDTWVLDLDESNTKNIPSWKKLFSAKEAFQLESLRPDDLHDLVLRMAKNVELFEKFHRFFMKNSSQYEPCPDKQCIADKLCYTVIAYSGDNSNCKRITDLVFKEEDDDDSDSGGNSIQQTFRWGYHFLIAFHIFLYSKSSY